MARMLIINPGSTSTKIGIFENDKKIFEEAIRHKDKEILKFENVIDQFAYRKEIIKNMVIKNGFIIDSFDLIVGRGGQVKPIESGTYEVNKAMIEDMKSCAYGEHASSLGGIIAKAIADEIGVKAYVVDPPLVDEMHDLARISGLRGIERISSFHALNQKSVAKLFSSEKGKKYEDLNLIVAHMGGGVTVGAHLRGRVIDVDNGLDGDGAFSPERSGGLPLRGVLAMCYSGDYSYQEMKIKVSREGGLFSYFGTKDAKEVAERAESGDKNAALVYEAMAYQIAKQIGSLSTVLEGSVDAILLTGGIAYDEKFVNWIIKRVSFIAPIFVYPGENELQALAEGAIRVLENKEELKEYS